MRRRSGTQSKPYGVNDLQEKYSRPQRLLDSRSKNQQEIPSGLEKIQRIMKVQSIQEKQHRIFSSFKKQDEATPSPRRKNRKTSYYQADEANQKAQDVVKQVNSPITLLKSERGGERFSDKKKYGKSSDNQFKKMDGSGNLPQSRHKPNKSNIYIDDKLSHSQIVEDDQFKNKIVKKQKNEPFSQKIQIFSPKMCDSSHQEPLSLESPTISKNKKMYIATVTNQKFQEKMKEHYFDSRHTSQKGSQIQERDSSSLIDSRKGVSQAKPTRRRQQNTGESPNKRNRDLQQIKEISSSKHVSQHNRNRKYSFYGDGQSGKPQLDKLYKFHKNFQNISKKLAFLNSSLDNIANQEHWQQIMSEYQELLNKLLDLQGQVEIIINLEQSSPNKSASPNSVLNLNIQNYKKEIAQLTEENKKINQKHQRLMQQYTFAKQNIDQINKDKQQLVRELHQQHKITLSKSQVPDQMKRKIDLLEQQNRGYANQVNILNDYIKNLGEQNKKLKKDYELLKQSELQLKDNLTQLKRLKGLLKQRQSELQMVKSSPALASQSNSLESDQIMLLSQDLKQSKEQIEKLKRNARVRQQQQKQLFQAKVNDLENQIKISVVSLQQKNNDLEMELNKTKNELQKKSLETSLQGLKKLELELNHKQAQIERLNLTIKSIQKEFEQQNNQIIRPQNQKIISLQQELAHKNYQIKEMEAQIIKLNQIALSSTASIQKEKYVQDAEIVSLLKQQNDRLLIQTRQKQKALDNLLQQNAKKKNDLNYLKRQLIQYKGFEEQVKNVNQLLQKKQKEILELKKQLSDKYQQANDIDMNREMIEQLNQELESKNIQLVKIKTHVVELQQTLNEREQILTNQQSQRQSYFRQLGRENDYLRIAINEKQLQLEKINQFLNIKDNVIEQKHAEIVKLQKIIDSQNKSIQNIKIHWSGELTKAEQQSQMKLLELEKSTETMKNELEQQISRLRQELSQSNEKYLIFSTNEKDLKNKLAILQQKKKHFQEHLSRHRQKIHEQTQQISILQKQLKEKKQELQQKQQKLEQKNKQTEAIKNIQKQYSSLQQKFDKERNKVKNLESKCGELQRKYSQKKIVEKKLNQSEKQIQTLQQKISTVEAKCQTLEKQSKNSIPAFMNMLKIRDFESNQIFQQKIIYQLKTENQKLRQALSGKVTSPQSVKNNQLSGRTIYSPKKQTNIKEIIRPQVQSDHFQFIKVRLEQFDIKLNQLIQSKKPHVSKANFLTPQYQQKVNFFLSNRARQQQKAKEIQQTNQAQTINEEKIRQLQFLLHQLQKEYQNLQQRPKHKQNNKNKGVINYSLALSGLQKQFKQEIEYLKLKNKEMQTKINELLQMNNSLKLQLEDKANNTNKLQKDSMIIYYKKQLKSMEQNLQTEKKRVEKISNQYYIMKNQMEQSINEKQSRNQYINKLQKQNTSLKSAIEQIQSTSLRQLKILREVKAQNEFEIQSLNNKTKQLMKKISNMEFELLQNRNILQLKQDINDQEVKRQANLMKREQEMFFKQIAEQEQKIKEKNKKILELRQYVKELQQQLKIKQDVCSTYKKKIMQFETMRTVDIQSSKFKQKNQQKASEQIRNLHMKISQLQYQLDCKMTEILNIKTKLNRMENAQQQHLVLQQNYYKLELNYNRLLQSHNFQQYKQKQLSQDEKSNIKLFENKFKSLHSLVEQLRQTFEEPISPISNKERILPEAILNQIKNNIQNGLKICQR